MRGNVELCMSNTIFFFFKQKTAYEMRISDWSSDVCSSDLRYHRGTVRRHLQMARLGQGRPCLGHRHRLYGTGGHGDRKSVVSGKSVSVRVDLGGRRIIKKKKEI